MEKIGVSASLYWNKINYEALKIVMHFIHSHTKHITELNSILKPEIKSFDWNFEFDQYYFMVNNLTKTALLVDRKHWTSEIKLRKDDSVHLAP